MDAWLTGNYTKLAGHNIKRITTQLINLYELLFRTSHRFSWGYKMLICMHYILYLISMYVTFENTVFEHMSIISVRRFHIIFPTKKVLFGKAALTFRHRASSIQDRRFASLQRTLFIHVINKYISLSDICLTVHHWYK